MTEKSITARLEESATGCDKMAALYNERGDAHAFDDMAALLREARSEIARLRTPLVALGKARAHYKSLNPAALQPEQTRAARAILADALDSAIQFADAEAERLS